jgi:large subunit ribosomal protein L22
MQYTALMKNALISDQKLRKIARDLKLRNRPVAQALEILNFMPKKGAKILYKVLSSAVANAEHQGNIDRSGLVVEGVQVDRGIRLKRFHPRARGRSSEIIKRRSHVIITVTETVKS